MDDPISDNLYRAANAVVNPANGQIVCASTLINPNNGCVPLDIFGNRRALESRPQLRQRHRDRESKSRRRHRGLQRHGRSVRPAGRHRLDGLRWHLSQGILHPDQQSAIAGNPYGRRHQRISGGPRQFAGRLRTHQSAARGRQLLGLRRFRRNRSAGAEGPSLGPRAELQRGRPLCRLQHLGQRRAVEDRQRL